MRTIRAVFCSLATLLSVVIYAQEMTMDAKEFNNRKEVSDERIRSDYRDATGKQFVTIKVENSASILAVTYDVEAEKGKAALLVKYQDEVIWEKEIAIKEQANIEVELPKEGEYLLIIDLKNASGQHDIRWKLKPSPGGE